MPEAEALSSRVVPWRDMVFPDLFWNIRLLTTTTRVAGLNAHFGFKRALGVWTRAAWHLESHRGRRKTGKQIVAGRRRGPEP